MRGIDLIPIRLHKGEPTWDIIDELLEMIDGSHSEEEIQCAREDYYNEGRNHGYEDGYTDGRSDGCKIGQSDGYDNGYAEGFIDGFIDGEGGG